MAIWLHRNDGRCPVCKGKFKSVDLDGFEYSGVEIPKPFLMFMWFVKGGPKCCSKECALAGRSVLTRKLEVNELSSPSDATRMGLQECAGKSCSAVVYVLQNLILGRYHHGYESKTRKAP
jgi:hypothetical protein